MPDKTPPKSYIMTGYMLTKARVKFRKYILQAHECLIEASKDAVKNGDLAAQMEVSDCLADILKIASKVEADTASIHLGLRDKMLDEGYREITDDDFAEFGGGGGR